MTERGTPKPELNKICRFNTFNGCLYDERSPALLLAGDKIIEIRDPCPGGRFLVGIQIIPPIGRRQIHDTGTGVQTLGGKVRAISPQVFIIIIGWVSAVRPAVGILERSLPVIQEYRHRHDSSPFLIAAPCYALVEIQATTKENDKRDML